MPRRVAVTQLNARTIDVLNVIRQYAPVEYQNGVPEVTDPTDIPKVGEIICGYPAFANQFINALVNRIALVTIKSATFNNAYAMLKKGYLEFGETVEEVFIEMTKAREFSVEKAKDREFKRTLPDIRSAFHAMNWKVQYPVTIQNEDLRMAFISAEGVQDLIAKIFKMIDVASEYDEFLLFKYLMIKGYNKGAIARAIYDDSTDIKTNAKVMRGVSNMLTFPKTDYNQMGVHNDTPKKDQYVFIDAMFDAEYDVDILASAFNMDKATFIGNRMLIDDWTTFDNDRFREMFTEDAQIEEVTAEELQAMADVRAMLIDKEWFQVYDNLAMFTEDYVAAGIYWNYFYNVWKTVSSSPFSNAIVFVTSSQSITPSNSYNATISDVSVGEEGMAISLQFPDSVSAVGGNPEFIQNEDATELGIGVKKYGSLVIPLPLSALDGSVIDLEAKVNGVGYTSANFAFGSAEVGDTVTFAKNV